MPITARLLICALVCVAVPAYAQSNSTLATAGIDAAAGRQGIWIQGVYLENFPRADLAVAKNGVRLSPTLVTSFITFTGSGDDADAMGEICALPEEVTPVLAKLHAGGFALAGIHNHFLGESPRLMFLHFMAHGSAAQIMRSFRGALAATHTPLGAPPAAAAASTSPTPAWAATVEHALGRSGDYSASDRILEIDVPSSLFAPGPMDFWFENVLYFQEASPGKLAATGDLMLRATDIDRVLGLLLAHHFEIEALHNHMTTEEPRVFFLHFWKVGTPRDLAEGLRAALTAVPLRTEAAP